MRAFALVMLGRWAEALPALARARARLEAVPAEQRGAVEAKLGKAEALCRKKVHAKRGIAQGLGISEKDDEEYERAFLEQQELKFPSTAHLKNLGAATRDDKRCDECRQRFLCGDGHTVTV